MASYIFILALTDNRYFVGRSKNVKKRIWQHFQGRGSEWTAKYRPIGVIKIFQSKYIEERDMWTKRLMNQYSIDQVRGGSYVRIELTREERAFIQKEIRGAKDQCFQCGSNQHFIKDCPKKHLKGGLQQSASGYPRHELNFQGMKPFEPFLNSQKPKSVSHLEGKNLFEEDESQYKAQIFQKYFQIDQNDFEVYWNQLDIESGQEEYFRQSNRNYASDSSELIYRRQPQELRPTRQFQKNSPQNFDEDNELENSQERFSSYMSDFISGSSSIGSFIADDEEIIDSYESSEYGLSNLPYQPEESMINEQQQSKSLESVSKKEQANRLDPIQEEELLKKYLVENKQQDENNGSQNVIINLQRVRHNDYQSQSEQINCFRNRRKRSQSPEEIKQPQSNKYKRLKTSRNPNKSNQLLNQQEYNASYSLSQMKKFRSFLATTQNQEENRLGVLRKLRKL